MKKTYHFALTLFGIIFMAASLFSCSDELPQPDEKLTGNTVIMYMGAENSLHPNSYKDLDEMKMALKDIPENCQVVVYQDAELKPVIFHLTQNGITTWKTYEEDLDSSKPETVKNILNEIVKGFPSQKYSLVLWSHGDGWIEHANSRSIIVDNGNNSYSDIGSWLNISDLSKILSTQPHMEYILFDACYMQSVEVASQLYTHASYIIGSPTEIPADGAPYHLIMKALCEANIQDIIENYASAYPKSDEGVLLSAVSSEDFPAFCTETAKHIPSLFKKENMPNTTGIQIYAPAFGSARPYQSNIPVPYDIRSAMHRILDNENYKIWEQQWRKTILYPHKTNNWVSMYSSYYYGTFHNTMQDSEHYGGISMNIPSDKYSSYGWDKQFQQTEWYRLTSWDQTGW